MDEYISREAVLSKCQQIWNNADETTEIGVAIINIVDELADFVENIPLADVQPVKHGRWISTEELYYNGMTKCSCCNEEYYIEDIQNLQGDLRVVNYCPNCGARMRMDGDSE